MTSKRRAFLTRLALSGAAIPFASEALASQPLPKFSPASDASDEDVFAEARKYFLIPEGVAYCNTGTLGASPRQVVDALVQGIEKLEAELAAWPYFQADGEPLTGYQRLTEVREQMGALINAPVDEVALVQNATMGMGFLANGLDLEPDDEVLSTDQEHSGGIGPWRLKAKRHGIVVKELSIDEALKKGPDAVVQLFADAMTPRTRVVVFSQITSGLGIHLPTAELCRLAREQGALSIVDGAQAIGQVRVDMKALGCDAYVGSPHKWLMAPKGTGTLYIRSGVQERFWTTLASSAWEDYESGVFRFMQYGTGSYPVMQGLRAALDFIDAIGMQRIERWDLMLADRLRDGLEAIPRARLTSPADRRFMSAITTFAVEGVEPRQLQEDLWARNVRVRAQGGNRGVRLSAHIYVDPSDIDRVLNVVQSYRA
jgi:selenocysteine lyase/cysteine desulfurase